MLFKMIGKLLFKATIPLIIVAGLVTYGVYYKGGDPMAMWKGFGASVMEQVASLSSNVKDDASNAAQAVANAAKGESDFGKLESSRRTKVFTWKDAAGVTHYSTVAPIDADAQTISINPNTNVMAPIEIPKQVKVSSKKAEDRPGVEPPQASSSSASGNSRQRNEGRDYNDPDVQEVADQLGGELPGVVGQILSTQGESSGSALNPAQLLKMLQQ